MSKDLFGVFSIEKSKLNRNSPITIFKGILIKVLRGYHRNILIN